MERLTQKSINYCAEICRAQDCETYHGVRNDVCGDAAIYNRLAAYEDLEEQGRLVVLPCKVGDHLFAVTRNIVSEFAVSYFLMHSDLVWAGWDIVDGIFGHFRIDGIPTDSIGKTVFLTRAEAEKAMEASG